jgi:hypothetical protein
MQSYDKMIELFELNRVLDMPTLKVAFAPRSEVSLIRDLKRIQAISSYNFAGKFHTLKSIPDFDSNGLWQFEGKRFSVNGSLKATVRHLVTQSECGMTLAELQDVLKIKVQNTMLDLVNTAELQRKEVEGKYVYLGADRVDVQIERRLAVAPIIKPQVSLQQLVHILLAVIHGNSSVESVVKSLEGKENISWSQVECVFEQYGLKKN